MEENRKPDFPNENTTNPIAYTEKINDSQQPKQYFPIFTIIFIIISIILFIIQEIDLNKTIGLWMWPYDTQLWMFVTSIFLHVDIGHIFWNMIILFIFGIDLERRIGNRRFALIFLLSGIAGNVGYYMFAQVTDPSIPALGASGAIYGVFACLAILDPNEEIDYGMISIKMIYLLAIYAAIDIIFMGTADNIAHAAHLGGLVIGLVAGFALKDRFGVKEKPIEKYEAGNWLESE